MAFFQQFMSILKFKQKSCAKINSTYSKTNKIDKSIINKAVTKAINKIILESLSIIEFKSIKALILKIINNKRDIIIIL